MIDRGGYTVWPEHWVNLGNGWFGTNLLPSVAIGCHFEVCYISILAKKNAKYPRLALIKVICPGRIGILVLFSSRIWSRLAVFVSNEQNSFDLTSKNREWTNMSCTSNPYKPTTHRNCGRHSHCGPINSATSAFPVPGRKSTAIIDTPRAARSKSTRARGSPLLHTAEFTLDVNTEDLILFQKPPCRSI